MATRRRIAVLFRLWTRLRQVLGWSTWPKDFTHGDLTCHVQAQHFLIKTLSASKVRHPLLGASPTRHSCEGAVAQVLDCTTKSRGAGQASSRAVETTIRLELCKLRSAYHGLHKHHKFVGVKKPSVEQPYSSLHRHNRIAPFGGVTSSSVRRANKQL